MKKLLILNGSHSDVPLIEAGKRLGFHVTTTGNDPGLAGHRYADEYHSADFSDRQSILQLATDLRIDAICACANDFGAITAAYVAEKLGLPGHDALETVLTLHHKHRFKEFALANGISTPKATHYSDPAKAIEDVKQLAFPLIVKPVDLTGGKGITVATSSDEYVNAVHHAFERSRIGQFLVEEFIAGTYHSFSTFVLNRKIVFSFSDNEYSLNDSFHVSTSGGPATGIDVVRDQLLEECERIIGLLSLCDGIFHVQYIYAKRRAWIMEITRRCSGDFYPIPVKYSSGLEWAEWIVRAESGIDCSDFPQAAQGGYFGRHCVFARKNGVIGKLAIDPELDGNVIGSFPVLEMGDVVDERRASKLAAVVFLRFGSDQEMAQKVSRMNDLVSVEIA